MMKYLQKLGKALMLPVACLPICGILMGIGYALCPSTMQGGDVTGIVEMIGFFLVKAGGALIDNMAILFVIGVGVGMADRKSVVQGKSVDLGGRRIIKKGGCVGGGGGGRGR